MSTVQSTSLLAIPPLAGLAAYVEAARPGLGVEESVQRLLRYAWIEKRIMEVGLFWLASTPEWEVKEALGLHVHRSAEHVAALRGRIGEMRSPVPRMDVSPDPTIDAFFAEMLTAADTVEKIAGLYGLLRPALLAAYRAHYAAAHPVADSPTRHILRHIIVDAEDEAVWGAAAFEAVCADNAGRADGFVEHLHGWLMAAGGIGGEAERAAPPTTRVETPFVPDFFPQRDERFALRWCFVNPQRQVSLNEAVPLDERTLALMCRRIVEMDVPEYMTRIIAHAGAGSEGGSLPWAYFVEMTRQLWDEVRHAMLGTVYFESRGVDWKRLIAIHPGMAIRLGALSPADAHTVLYAIEQNLMPATTGKRLEYEISCNANDPLAAQIQDFDWADEVLHVHIGRQWLLPKLSLRGDDAVKRGWELRAATADVLDAWAERAPQENWWPALVREVLGRDTAAQSFDLTRL